MVYTAYPIDAVSVGGPEWERFMDDIEYAKSVLIDRGVEIVYDPGDAFMVGSNARIGREISHLNTVALNKATGLLAFLPKGIPSVGVPQEIDQASRAGIPVAVVTDHKSWNLTGPTTRVFGLGEGSVAATWLAAQESDHTIQSQNSTLQWKVADGGKAPTKAHHDDAGWDLYALDDVVVQPGVFRDIDCGVAVRFPRGVYGQITGRSSTLRKRGLLVNQGIIDTGYTGPLFAGVFNMGSTAQVIKKDERIAQMLIHSNWEWLDTKVVDDLGTTARGTAGFGSSGK